MPGALEHRRLYLRIAIGVAAAGALAAAIHFHQEVYAILLLPLALFFKGVAWRVGARRAALFLVVPLMSPRLRRRVRTRMGGAGAWLTRRFRSLQALWRRSPWAVRIVIALPFFLAACVAMLFLGGFLGVLAVLPFGAALRFFAAGWIGKWLLPLCARAAAGHGIDRIFPSVWEHIPARARDTIALRNKKLWRATMRRLVKSRKIVGRRAAVVLRQTRSSSSEQRAYPI